MRDINLLLLGNNQISNQLLRLKMRSLPVKLIEVVNAFEALSVLSQQHVDAIILDLDLTGEDPWAILKELKAVYPEKHPKLIALTSATHIYSEELCLKTGFDCYQRKPFNVDDFKKNVPKIRESSENVENFLEKALRHLMNDQGLLLEISAIFLKHIDEDLKRAESTLENKKWEEAVIQIHSLKGTVGAFGKGTAFYLAREAEQRLRQQEYETVATSFPELKEEILKMRNVLTDYRNR